MTNRSLRLQQLTPRSFGRLLDAPDFDDVTVLDLSGKPALGPDAIELLGVSGHLAHLEALDVSAIPVGDRGVRALPGHAGRLRCLTCGAATASAVGYASPNRWRALSVCELGPGALEALPELGALEALHIPYVVAEPAAWRPLLRDLVPRLTSFGTTGANLPPLSELGRLEALHLDLCAMGDEGAAALTRLPSTLLRSLVLPHNDLGVAGFAALVAASWPALERLDVSGNALGESGLRALAARTGLPALRRLGVRDHHVPTGARELWYDQGAVVGEGDQIEHISEIQRRFFAGQAVMLDEPSDLWDWGWSRPIWS